MSSRPTRSLRYEYELFIQEEIENYKDSVSRSALLAIGDEAAAILAASPQTVLTELLLCEEVDRIIAQRLGLPSYQKWRRKQLKLLAELRRPEYWGLTADDALVHATRVEAGGRALVAGARDEAPALYLAANGCDVTTIGAEQDAVRRVLDAAAIAGLGARVHGAIGDLRSWVPPEPLSAVVCGSDALIGLSPEERMRVLVGLQGATRVGGVHLVQAGPASGTGPMLDELRSRYAGWTITVEPKGAGTAAFVARKSA